MKKTILVLMLGLMMISLVSAIELNPFANIKTYESNTKEDMSSFIKEDFNSEYGVIRLSKTFFWFESDKIAEYSLISNTEQCLIDCEAKGKAVLYSEGRLFDDTRFQNKIGDYVNVNAKYYIKGTEEYTISIPDKEEEVCVDVMNNKTLKYEKECYNETISYKEETKTREIWKEYNGEVLESGNYEWKLRGTKNPLQSIDFIPIKSSLSLNEWAWWNSSWSYKQELTIGTAFSNTWNNYSVYMNVVFDEYMNSDFSDLRFLNEDEDAELDYFISNKTDESSAKVYVKTDLSNVTNTTIYMYYGNSDAESTSDISKAFLYFDNFTDNHLSSYTTLRGTWSMNSEGDGLLKQAETNPSDGQSAISLGYWNTTSNGLEAIAYWKSSDFNYMTFPLGLSTVNTYHTQAFGHITYNSWGDSLPQPPAFGGNAGLLTPTAVSGNTWTETKIQVFKTNSSDSNWTGYINNVFRKSYQGSTGSWSYDAVKGYKVATDHDSIEVDWVRVRQYSYPEPTTSFGERVDANPFSVYSISPVNGYNSSSILVTIIGNVTDDTSVLNMSIIIDDEIEGTLYNTTENQLNITGGIEFSINEGNHNWSIYGCDELICKSSLTRTLKIDSTPPEITINTPLNQTYYNPSVDIVNVTATDTLSDVNACWYTFDNLGSEFGGDAITDLTFDDANWVSSENLTIDANSYNLTVYCNDSLNNYQSSSVILSGDSTPPTIVLTSPNETYSFVTINDSLNLNWTVTDLGINSCWYNYDGTNISVNCEENTTSFNVTDLGITSLIFYANDSMNNLNSETISWGYLLSINSVTYNTTTYRSKAESIIINVSGDGIEVLSANLYYNGTKYTSTKSGTNQNALFTVALYPSQVGDNLFFWEVFKGTYSANTSDYTQTVSGLAIGSVGVTCGDITPVSCFNFANETTLTSSTENNVKYTFNYGLDNSSLLVLNGSLSNITSFCLCMNTTDYPEYTVGYGEVQYSKSGTADRRYYLFSGTKVSNITSNYTLYQLDSDLVTTFSLSAKSTTLSPYVNHYITTMKWYPQINEYRIVEMSKTDDKGETVNSVQVSSIDYRYGLYTSSGTLIKLFDPIRMVCTSSPCAYNFIVAPTDNDLTSHTNIQNNLSFDETTNLFTFIWSDPTQTTHTMNLSIYKDTPTSRTLICSEEGDGFVGIIQCDVTGYSGQLYAVVERSASPFTPIANLVVEIRTGFNSISGGTFALFIGFVLSMLVALVGYYNPIICILLVIAGLVPLYALGTINWMIFVSIAGLGGIVWHFVTKS